MWGRASSLVLAVLVGISGQTNVLVMPRWCADAFVVPFCLWTSSGSNAILRCPSFMADSSRRKPSYTTADKRLFESALYPLRNSDAASSSTSIEGQRPFSPDRSTQLVTGDNSVLSSIDHHGSSKLSDSPPTVEDLNRNLDQLRTDLDEKQKRFSQTVQTLQDESDRAIASVQDWDEFYLNRMDKLNSREPQTENPFVAEETNVKESGNLAANEKVYWLAEQLQRVKSTTQQSALESELELKNQELQFKLKTLQQELKQQQEATESEHVKYEQLWKNRIALETEVAEIQKKLRQSIQSLQSRLSEETHGRTLERRQHSDQLSEIAVQNEAIIQKMREESAIEIRTLTKSLEGRDHQLKQVQFQLRDSQVNRLTIDSSILDKHKAEQNSLIEHLQRKEQELVHQVALTVSANEKAKAQLLKRLELEKELSKIKHEFDETIRESKFRLETLQNERASEVSALKQLVASKVSENEALTKAALEKRDTNQCHLEKSLADKDEHYKQLIVQVQEKTEMEKRKLLDTVEMMRTELYNYKMNTEKKLLDEKASFESMQNDLRSQLVVKEQEMKRQVNLQPAVESSSVKEKLERELLNLKHNHESSLIEWKLRIQSIQKERSEEHLRMEAKLARTKASAMKELEEAQREASRRQLELELQLSSKEEEYRVTLQQSAESSKRKQFESDQKLVVLTQDLQVQQMESHYNLTRTKKEYEDALSKLQLSITSIEGEFAKQVELTLIAESQLQVDQKLRFDLESSLSKLESEKQELESTIHSLQSQLSTVRVELESVKHEQINRLNAELESSQRRNDQLVIELASKSDELRKQRELAISTEMVSSTHRQKKEETEKELESLKCKFDAVSAESDEHVKGLENEHRAQQLNLEALLTTTKSNANTEIENVRRESAKRQLDLEMQLEKLADEHRKELQALRMIPEEKKNEVNKLLKSLSLELQQYKSESHRQISKANQSAEKSMNELESLLSSKQLQYDEQKQIASTAEAMARAEVQKRVKLENELIVAKDGFEKHVAGWESRYKSLLESRDEALKKAETLLSRKEVETRSVLDSITDEFESAKLAYAESLIKKDKDHEAEMERRRVNSDAELNKVRYQFHNVSNDYASLKLETRQWVNELGRETLSAKNTYTECLKLKDEDLKMKILQIQSASDLQLNDLQREVEVLRASEKSLFVERERREKQEVLLRAELAKKDAELAEQTSLANSFRDTVESLMAVNRRKQSNGISHPSLDLSTHSDFESRFSELHEKHQSDVAEWESKCKTLRQKLKSRDDTIEKLIQNSSSSISGFSRTGYSSPLLNRDQYSSLSSSSSSSSFIEKEAQLRQRELKSEIQGLAMRHVQEIQELEEASRVREDALQSQVHTLQEKLRLVETEAGQVREAEKTACLAKQETMIGQIEQYQRHLDQVLKLYEQEKTKNRRLSRD